MADMQAEDPNFLQKVYQWMIEQSKSKLSKATAKKRQFDALDEDIEEPENYDPRNFVPPAASTAPVAMAQAPVINQRNIEEEELVAKMVAEYLKSQAGKK